VRRRGVEVVVTLLDVLAVIAFWARQPEEPLLKNGIVAVPQREREREATLAIADAEEAVFTPAINAASCMVVREEVPAVTLLRIILAHRSPLPLGEVRTPALPVVRALRVVLKALKFGNHHATV
jgi:hypothetical protein